MFTRLRELKGLDLALSLGVAGLVAAAACAAVPSGRTGRAEAVFPGPVEAGPCGRAFVFVDHGRPAARIEIPEGAGEVERRAADILQTSIFKMTGVDLPVIAVPAPDKPGVAAIGFPRADLPAVIEPSLASLRPDGFAIATSQGNLYVAGVEGRGLVYGVVHLLEKYYGCRRYS